MIEDILDEFIRQCCPTTALWERLAEEGNFELIEKLRRVEKGELGYGTIVVPHDGFSEEDETHNLVLDWLEEHGVNILNVGLEKARLEQALYGKIN
jgi:hypothetical protein